MLWLSKDLELISSRKFLSPNLGILSRETVMEWFGKRACTIKGRDNVFLFGDTIYSNLQIHNIMDRSLPLGAEKFTVTQCQLLPPHKDIISWSLNSEEEDDWYMAPESALTHPNVLRCFVPVYQFEAQDVFATISFQLYSTTVNADAIFFSGLHELVRKHKSDAKQLIKVCFSSPSTFQRKLIEAFVSKHSIQLVIYEWGQDHLMEFKPEENQKKTLPNQLSRLIIGVYPNRTILLFQHNKNSLECDGLIRKSETQLCASPSQQLGMMLHISPPNYCSDRVVFGRKVTQCESVPLDIEELRDLDTVLASEDVAERLLRFGHVVLQFSLEDMRRTIGGINYTTALEFERQELYPLDDDMEAYAVVGQSDKFQLRFKPAVDKSHQIPTGVDILTEDKTGFRFLMEMRSDETKHHFYLKGPPGWGMKKWKGHDYIFNSDKNGFHRMRYSLPGINVPFVYLSPGVSFFAIHSEDGNLYSFNILLAGTSKKYWWIIPRRFYTRFVKWLNEYLGKKDIPNFCPNILQHKFIFVPPYDIPEEFEISFVEQNPGQAVIVDVASVHWGFNGGPNMAYSFNFAGKDWLTTFPLQPMCNFNKAAVKSEISFPTTESTKAKFSLKVNLKDLLKSQQQECNSIVNERAVKVMHRNFTAETCQTPTDARSLLYYLCRYAPFQSTIDIANLEEKEESTHELETGKRFLPIKGSLEPKPKSLKPSLTLR